MTNDTYKSPLAVLLLITATLLAVVGHHAATAQDQGQGQGGDLSSCLVNCRFRVISCTTGCRIGGGPFPFTIRICLGQCSLQNIQCLASCISPTPNNPNTPQKPPRRPILPPIFHRPPGKPILPPIFHRPPGKPILPPIFHRPPGSPLLPPIFHRPPRSPASPPLEPHPIIPYPPQSLISRPKPPTLTTKLDPLPSSSAYDLPLPPPPAQVDNIGQGN